MIMLFLPVRYRIRLFLHKLGQFFFCRVQSCVQVLFLFLKLAHTIMLSISELISTVWTVEEECLTVITPVLNYGIARCEFLNLLFNKFLVICIFVLHDASIVFLFLFCVAEVLSATGSPQAFINAIFGSTRMFARFLVGFTVLFILACTTFVLHYALLILTLRTRYAVVNFIHSMCSHTDARFNFKFLFCLFI